MNVILSLDDTKRVILAAFDRWLDQKPESFEIQVGAHRVGVTIELREKDGNKFFDCGMPGYTMANADLPALTAWVPDAIQSSDRRGVVRPRPLQGKVNIQLQTPVYVLFNFHLYM